MSAPDLALAGTDPAGFVLAVADLREYRTENATTGDEAYLGAAP